VLCFTLLPGIPWPAFAEEGVSKAEEAAEASEPQELPAETEAPAEEQEATEVAEGPQEDLSDERPPEAEQTIEETALAIDGPEPEDGATFTEDAFEETLDMPSLPIAHDGSETRGAIISLGTPFEAQLARGMLVSFSAPTFESTYVPPSIVFRKASNGEEHDCSGRYSSGGKVAYCLNLSNNAPFGAEYGATAEPGLVFYTALLLGYPTRTTIGTYALSDDQAREATQFAIWALGYKIPGNDYALLSSARASSLPGAKDVLAAGLWLYEQCRNLPNTPLSQVNLNKYFDMGTLHSPVDTTPVFWDVSADTLRSGPYRFTSIMAGANPKYTPTPGFVMTDIPPYAYYGDANGNPIASPGYDTDFYLFLSRANMTNAGNASVKVTLFIRTPASLVYKPAETKFQNMLTPVDPLTGGVASLAPLSWDTPVIVKTDARTDAPLAGATFELHTWPVAIQDGHITTDISAIASDDPGWAQVGPAITSAQDGTLDFGVLPYGCYRLVETSPAPGYQGPAQTGSSPYVFVLDATHRAGNIVLANHRLESLEIIKKDAQTGEALAGATFELYAYPVTIQNGRIITDTSAIAPDDGAWQKIATATSDDAGTVSFPGLSFGYYRLVETAPPPGYQTADEAGYAPYVFALDSTHPAVPIEIKNHRLSGIELIKQDAHDQRPLADTEFELSAYPVTIKDGRVITDTSTIAPDDPAWQVLDRRVTDEAGRLCFDGLPFGYYRLVEVRPNPAYIEDDTPRFVTLDKYATGQAQVLENMAVQIGVEVYQDTINLTSAALATEEGDPLNLDNTNQERYHYDLDFRSTSNVRADEFTVIDPLNAAALDLLRLEELFTPVAWGDTDGRFNLWFRTNLTDPHKVYSEASAMAQNPYNPNNPDNRQLWPSVGWQLWQEGLSTTRTTRLLVADLGLEQEEYITGLRFEYGSVEVGFTTRNTVRTSLQEEREGRARQSDWSVQGADNFYQPQAAGASGLKPATYLVSCPRPLAPPTVIEASAYGLIARNLVLSDEDNDAVRTEVIAPFMLKTNSQPPTDLSTLESEGSALPFRGHLPQTGEAFALLSLLLGLGGLFGLGTFLLQRRPQKRNRP
jgi:TQXA domain-containing protein/LPXTG-motif cell wall-anchored protein